MENKPVLFRCSRLGDLMTEPRNKADKEAGNLSETAKTFVEDIWLKDHYGFEEPVWTDQMLKGLLNEQDSMALVQQVLGGEFRIKNKDNFRNEYLKGTPDIIQKKEGVVEDVKTSWTIRTFFNSELEKNYYWQGIGYMALTGLKKYRLIYCLTDTPDEIIVELKKRVYFRFNCDEDNPHLKELYELIDRNHHFSHIPPENRIRVFPFEFSQVDYDMLIMKIEKAREYYKTLHL